MKTVRIALLFVMMISFGHGFSQDRGFFRIYERDDKSFGASDAIELPDGSFIVAANDRSIFNELWGLEINGELVKLSAEGELLRSVPVTYENGYCRIENIFRHPIESDLFIGTGEFFLAEGLPDVQHSRPFLIQFDDELNITLKMCPEWPEELHDYSLSACTMVDRNGKVFSENMLHRLDTARILRYRRFYTQMSAEGETEFMVEDSTDIQQITPGITEAVFEFPVTGQKGFLRKVHGDTVSQKLYGLNKDNEAEEINNLYRFAMDTAIYYNEIGELVYSTYYICLLDYVSTTVTPLNDSTLLYAFIGDEHQYIFIPSQPLNQFLLESSAVMFKTDLDGNIRQEYAIFGSLNETIEAIPRCSYGITEEDAAGNKYIYFCCHTERLTTPTDSPNKMTIIKMTEDLDIVWQKTYAQEGVYMQARHVLATGDGGCFVVGVISRDGQRHHDIFALKIGSDGTLGTNEITVTDEMFFYPNPVKNVLHLHYPANIPPQSIELYDLQGRLVRAQTANFESFGMAGLAAGQYVMKVTLADGKVYSDKVVKE